MLQIKDMLKFQVISNRKEPACKWSEKCNQFTDIDSTLYNVGLITGTVNDIIVLVRCGCER